jgi:hypothetical protein
VTVPAGSIRVITVEPPKNTTRFGLLVTPLLGSGPVFGVRWLDEQGPRGPLVSALPLRTSPLSVLVPDTVSDPAAGTLAR